MKPFIVGVDPGTTLGYAIIDMNAKLIDIGSSKYLSLPKLISHIIVYGDAVIVVSDKKKVPSFVQSLAVKLGSRLITPKYDMRIREKRELTRGYKFRNYHEMDSLASALYAYNEVKELLNKINQHLTDIKKKNLLEQVQKLVLLKGMSIKHAVSFLEESEEEIIMKKVKEKRILKEEDFLKLYSKIKKMERELILLRKHNINLKERLNKLEAKEKYLINKIDNFRPEDKINKLLNFKEKRIHFFDSSVKSKNNEINKLQNEISLLIKFLSDTNKRVLLKKINNLGSEEYSRKKLLLNIAEDDVLLVNNPNIFSEKVINELKNKVKLIIHKSQISKKILQELPFIFINYKDLDIEENNYFALADRDKLEKEKSNAMLLTRIVSSYRKERNYLNSE